MISFARGPIGGRGEKASSLGLVPELVLHAFVHLHACIAPEPLASGSPRHSLPFARRYTRHVRGEGSPQEGQYRGSGLARRCTAAELDDGTSERLAASTFHRCRQRASLLSLPLLARTMPLQRRQRLTAARGLAAATAAATASPWNLEVNTAFLSALLAPLVRAQFAQ